MNRGNGVCSIEAWLRKFVGQSGSPAILPFQNFHHFVLAHGRPFRVSAFPRRYRRYRGNPKFCFANAVALAQRFPGELRYAEGFASHRRLPGFATLHGWAVDRSGLVIDPTWTDGGCTYYGVLFSLGYVERTLAAGRASGVASVIDNFEEGWPLLNGAHVDWIPG